MLKPDISWLTARPIAHRGLHDRNDGIIENCSSAFARAVERNFAIELDVQVTKDGKAAVFHDYQLDRLTESSGVVAEWTLSELSSVEFKEGSDRIIGLEQLLADVAGAVPLIIELKAPTTQDGRLEKAVAQALDGYVGHAAVMSFSPEMIQLLKTQTKRPRGIVACDMFTDKDGVGMNYREKYHLSHILHANQTQPDFISYKHTDLPSPAIDLMRALFGLPVICWTTKDVESHKRAMNYCDQVTFEGYNPDDLT